MLNVELSCAQRWAARTCDADWVLRVLRVIKDLRELRDLRDLRELRDLRTLKTLRRLGSLRTAGMDARMEKLWEQWK